jgi:hypothetical protein
MVVIAVVIAVVTAVVIAIVTTVLADTAIVPVVFMALRALSDGSGVDGSAGLDETATEHSRDQEHQQHSFQHARVKSMPHAEIKWLISPP